MVLTSANVRPPEQMRHLRFDEYRQLPIPWFVRQEPGEPVDFRIADANKFVRAIKRRLCWACGRDLSRMQAYLVGPMCEITCVTAEPPMHVACAEYSVQACPFLSQPKMRRSPRAKPEEATVEGVAIERNPGVAALLVTKEDVRPFKAGKGWLLQIPHAFRREYWCERRQATVDEVWHSTLTGFPILLAEAKKESLAAVVELALRLRDYRAQLTHHFGQAPAPREDEANILQGLNV